jgi:hypothetical protein
MLVPVAPLAYPDGASICNLLAQVSPFIISTCTLQSPGEPNLREAEGTTLAAAPGYYRQNKGATTQQRLWIPCYMYEWSKDQKLGCNPGCSSIYDITVGVILN